MKKVKVTALIMMLCFSLVPAAVNATAVNINVTTAPDDTFAATEIRGHTDWRNGVVQAMGVGVPPVTANSPAQANAMARRAAVVDAYRNLIEQVGEVRVEAATTVRNYEIENDTIKTRISGLVQGARVINEQFMPDGSCQVTVEVDLFGANSVAAAIEDKFQPAQILPMPLPSPDYQSSATADIPAYTGIIVDARGLGLERVMSPRIYDETGRIVYGNMYIDSDIVVHRGMVDYLSADDMTSVGQANSRAGTNPLVVKAIGLRDFNANVVISQADADRILAANAATGFFARTAVVFEQ